MSVPLGGGGSESASLEGRRGGVGGRGEEGGAVTVRTEVCLVAFRAHQHERYRAGRAETEDNRTAIIA